jgi:hypothetical protein
MTGGLRARIASPTAILAVLLAAGVAASSRDLLTGGSTPFYRDLGSTQRPDRALFSSLGPASLNPHASFGQPYAGNPNLLLAYPFPRGSRWLGAHLLLHLGLGFLGSWVFFRRLVRSEEAAFFGALSFGLSGYVLSSTAFLNATTTIAWTPWLLAAVHAARNATGRRLAFAASGIAAASALLVLGGEPALGAFSLLLALAVALTGPAGTRLRAAGALALGGTAAAAALSPWLLEVLRASAFSSRRVRGFSFAEFAAVGFHPARFLETPFPLLFGDPTRLGSGAYWGFAISQGNPPYLASLSFGILPLVLAAAFVVSARRYEGRLWISVAGLSLLASVLPWLPGARSLYEALPPLHVVRYPVKAILPFTFALAALAALGVDRLLVEEALPRFRQRASWALLGLAAAFAALAAVGRLQPRLVERALLSGWDSAWKSDPHLVLGRTVERVPVQAALAAATLLVAAILFRRGAPDAGGRFLLLLACAAGGVLAARPFVPRVASALYETPSPLVARAAAIPGRVFERALKDLDTVRRGLAGRTAVDERLTPAFAQAFQGWALAGAPHGLRYAWDTDADGSYTFLNRLAADAVNQRDWPRRLRWLRAAGVGSVIASDVPAGLPGLEPLLTEDRAGLPATLYALSSPLPGVRRASRAFPAASVTEAVALFEGDGFDPATDVVVYGAGAARLAPGSPDTQASARVVDDGSDVLTIETAGSLQGVLHVDRSFTPRVRATVNGGTVPALVADVHLIGVPVPAGASRVRVELAPR